MSEIKDLADEYLNKVADSAIYFKNGKFPDMPLFQVKDIKDAFNAGRQSIINNLCRLEWEYLRILEPFGLTEIVCRTKTSFSEFLIIRECATNIFILLDSKDVDVQQFDSLEKAKQYASKLHKKQVREKLGI